MSALDEGRVAAGEKFLRHPKVADAPLSQKMQFLESKGLTPDEIHEAMRRAGQGAGAGGGALTAAPAPPGAVGAPMPAPPFGYAMAPPPPPPPMWLRAALPGSIIGGFALAAYAVSAAYGDWKAAREVDRAAEASRRAEERERRLAALAEGRFLDGDLEGDLGELDGGDGDVDRLCRAVARLSRTVARQEESLRQSTALVARLAAQTEALGAA
eukprot:CAMPEP_0118879664 /NCGR_PEP_ID=MMETSP1163-20130328/19411_1 /TAXON_ID=124430 /ORGANISM="Phaeomonas parva, Strain CCMP2877" /LENGTH=212 /DNA_ID=CAMNT_0006815871 /DNA_START=298 /DNA_END=933 /DNA_ORIENTATION=+